jgi:hypothetical protein
MTTEDSAGLARETQEPTTDMETEDPPALQIEKSKEDPNIDQEGKFMIRVGDQILSEFAPFRKC